MANTTNFNWETPDDTDLVKDGAAAIRTLGSAIDTSLVDLKGGTTGQVLSKATNADMDFTWVAQDDSNAIQNALLTTTGDTIYASGASTPARLGIGSSGQVLTVAAGVPSWETPSSFTSPLTTKGDLYTRSSSADTRLAVGATNGHVLQIDSAEATGLKWGAAPAPTGSFTLLNSGGTSLSGSTTTISSLSGYNSLRVIITGGSTNGSGSVFIRLNSDSTAKYTNVGQYQESASTYNIAYLTSISNALNASSSIQIGYMATAAATFAAGLTIDGTNSTNPKWFTMSAGADAVNGNARYITQGLYTGSDVISSISVVISSGSTFDAGTVYVYGGTL